MPRVAYRPPLLSKSVVSVKAANCALLTPLPSPSFLADVGDALDIPKSHSDRDPHARKRPYLGTFRHAHAFNDLLTGHRRPSAKHVGLPKADHAAAAYICPPLYLLCPQIHLAEYPPPISSDPCTHGGGIVRGECQDVRGSQKQSDDRAGRGQ